MYVGFVCESQMCTLHSYYVLRVTIDMPYLYVEFVCDSVDTLSMCCAEWAQILVLLRRPQHHPLVACDLRQKIVHHIKMGPQLRSPVSSQFSRTDQSPKNQ